MVFLLYQKPYDIQLSESSAKKPNLEMFDVTNYSITKEGISRIVNATKVLRFVEHDEFYDIDAIRKKENNLLENVKANSATLVKDDFHLRGNVRYKNSNNVKFSSQEVDYNLKTKVGKTDVDFVLEDNQTKTRGTSLVYNTIDGKIYADNIKSTIEEDKK
jgi:LPS export ABC transporter protein LptC